MSRELVESILLGDYVSSQELFEQKISDIKEKKLYEAKRMVAAENTSKEQWAKYRKKNPSLSFYGTPDNPRARKPAEKREKTSTGAITKHGLAVRRKKGYLKASDAINATKFLNAVSAHLEKNLKEQAFDPLEQAKKRAAAAQAETARRKRAQGAPGEPYKQEPASSTGTSTTQTDKFGDTKPTALKKDPRRRTTDRFMQNLDRARKLYARGSKTALPRFAKIARGYAGTLAKGALKSGVLGALKAGVGTVADVGSRLDPVT